MSSEKKPLPIRMIGDPVLGTVAKPVGEIDGEIRELAERMIESMYAADGIGLAAPQVGVSKRMFVLHVSPPEDADGNLLPVSSPGEAELLPKMPMAFVNPEVTPAGTDEVEREEGCLSLPKLYAKVKRPEFVILKARLLDGREIRVECGGLLARAIQHENDHLDGVVFAQKLDDANLEKIKKGIDRLLKKTGRTNYKLKRVN